MSKSYPLRIDPPQNDIRKHFAMIPNMLFEMGLGLQAFRLITHLLYINATCFRSTRTLADECQMSVGSLIMAKRELKDLGLIVVEETRDNLNRVNHRMQVIDLWEMNQRWQAAKRQNAGNDNQAQTPQNLNDTVQQVNDTVQRVVRNNTPNNNTYISRAVQSDQNPTPKTDPANAVSAPPANAGVGIDGRKRPQKKDSEGQTGVTEKPFTPSQSEGEAPPPQDVPPAPPAPRKNRTPRPADPVIEAVREGSFKGAAVTSRIAGVGQYLLKSVYGDGATLEQGQALAAELKDMYRWYPQATKGLTPPTAGDKVYSWLRTYQAANGAVKPPKPPCAVCAGKGWVWINYQARTTATCPDCGGGHDE